mgnify:CR=1 FL=1
MDDEKSGLEKLITTAETWATQTGARLWPKPMPAGFETTFVVQAIRGSVDAAMSIKHAVLGDDYSWDVTDYEGQGPAATVAHNLQVKSHDVTADNCGKALLIATVKARLAQIENSPR